MESPTPLPTDPDEEVARLVPMVYDELRRIAAAMLRGDRARTLQPTALVHEAFLNMGAPSAGWADEGHFRAIASLAMRRVLADHVRGRHGQKRGGGRRPVSLDVDALGTGVRHSAADLHAVLEELEALKPRVARLVIYRFFGDLSVQQAAERLAISLSTAEADWRFARAWLTQRLRESPA
jgi:RNA polymerase sigma factor (TIGR02999 family)